MELTEALAAKQQAEGEIEATLKAFIEATGLEVREVAVRVVDVTSVSDRRRRVIADVTLEVRL